MKPDVRGEWDRRVHRRQKQVSFHSYLGPAKLAEALHDSKCQAGVQIGHVLSQLPLPLTATLELSRLRR